jgi:hypothetical protein
MPEVRVKYLDPNRKKKEEIIFQNNLKEDIDTGIRGI